MVRRSPPQQPSETNDPAFHQRELGAVGRILGSKDQAAIYIAGLIAFVALVGVILVATVAPEKTQSADVIKGLTGVVVAALTFIGGKSSRG